MLTTDTASVYTDFNGLAKLKQGAREQTPEAIKEVAKQFESVFLGMMLKSMRQAKLADGAMDNKQSEFYRDMYDQQMSIHLAGKPGVGLADLIAKQLSPKQKQDDEEALQAGDYLNRALGISGQNTQKVIQPAYQQAAKADALSLAAPLSESGLSRLQESLAQLEQSQQALEEQWQTMDSEIGGRSAAINKQIFMSQLLPHAQEAATALGVDANVLLAQAALETG